MQPPRTIFLAGPTAVGKSEAALVFAEKWGAEIISVDSMQVYRGMDIGTAKPTPAERARVKHHLIDAAAIHQSFDAAQFAAAAAAAAAAIHAQGKIALFCGGTGLYFKACREGLGNAPPADPALRAELEKLPKSDLLAELERRDPALFARIDQNNPRRIIRALEVIRLTNRPYSEQRAVWAAPDIQHTHCARLLNLNPSEPATEALAGSSCFFYLQREREDLHRRIEQRVDRMFAGGWVQETEALLSRGLAENRTALQAIGYREIIDHLRGARTLEETVALVKQRTRQYSKRQATWFRRQAGVRCVRVAPQDDSMIVADALERLLGLNEPPTTSE